MSVVRNSNLFNLYYPITRRRISLTRLSRLAYYLAYSVIMVLKRYCSKVNYSRKQNPVICVLSVSTPVTRNQYCQEIHLSRHGQKYRQATDMFADTQMRNPDSWQGAGTTEDYCTLTVYQVVCRGTQ